MATIHFLLRRCQKQTDDEKKNTNKIDECQLFFEEEEGENKERNKGEILDERKSETDRQSLKNQCIYGKAPDEKKNADQKFWRCEYLAERCRIKRMRHVFRRKFDKQVSCCSAYDGNACENESLHRVYNFCAHQDSNLDT